MAGAGGRRGRALSELLAGRSKKQKREPQTEQNLQEAALRLLSFHQNPRALLLEVESALSSKPLCSCSSGKRGNDVLVPELLVVSALEDQASALGVPLGIFSARAAVANIEKLSAESGQTGLLNAEQREKMSCLLQTLKDLLARNAFCRLLFAEEMWKMQNPLRLEVAWYLHRENIVSLEELLEHHPDPPVLAEWLYSGLCLLCHQTGDSSLDTKHFQLILTDTIRVLLCHGFQKKKLEPRISKIGRSVLERMLAWVLDTVAKGKQQQQQQQQQEEEEEEAAAAATQRAVKSWLGVFGMAACQAAVSPEALQQFFSHLLTLVLTYNPQLKVSDAIQLQRGWSFARTSSLLPQLYRKLFVTSNAEALLALLQQVLATNEVNWHHVLACVSTLLVCYPEAEGRLQGFLSQLLKKAFENYDLESLITAFLIARQAALEGPALFVPYSEWFKLAFGSAASLHCSSKKALVFLFKLLSDLVPFETPQYLKVHIMHPPFVATKYRPFLLEYITLAKTRLADLKVTIEDMGLFEDLSSMQEAVQPRCQALQDVEKAVQIFENTGKIPASVMEASIFRRAYFATRFIPALLVPRLLPETADSRMALIESLKRAEKIPPNTYSAYIEGCRAIQENSFRAQPAAMEVGDRKEPLEMLKAELDKLRLLVTDSSRHDAVAAQMALIAEELSGVLRWVNEEAEAKPQSPRIQIHLSAPDVDQRNQGAVELLLASFCQTAMAASYHLPPHRQGSWPSLFVKMVCGHRQLLPSLFSRLCQLLYHQGPSLDDAHILGLAVFAVHVTEARVLVPEVDIWPGVPGAPSARGLSAAELWDHFLSFRTGEFVVFCMKFCTVVVSYFLCRSPSLSHDCLCSLLQPGFVKKLQFAVMRLSLEARGIDCKEDCKVELPWESLSRSSPCYQKAALCLWKQTRFQELLQESQFQLTLREWLLMELTVHPDDDVLSAAERRDFHCWALYQHYLPVSAAAGGCEGDLRALCVVLMGTILDFCHRSELTPSSPLRKPSRSIPLATASPDIYCRLQEMLLQLEIEQWQAAPVGSKKNEEHFLLNLFQDRVKALGNGSAVGERLWRQRELLLQTRILVSLPPSILIATRQRGKRVSLDCEVFFRFVNTELRNICSRGYALSYAISAHFFRGLLVASRACQSASEEVTAVLALCQARCPLLLCSAAFWWQSLAPVLGSEWTRLFGAPLAQGLQSLGELQRSVSSFLLPEAASLVSDVPWISAAFLHFTIQRQRTYKERREVLKRLGPGAKQLLECLFFFSVMDLISARVAAPQEGGLDVPAVLGWTSEILQSMTERGMSWLAAFSSVGQGHSPWQTLRCIVSDQHLKLLPVAFYSLLFAFDLEKLVGEQAFLLVALDMYTQLLQLFMEGPRVAGLDPREQRPPARVLEDSLEEIHGARRFLLRAIPQCPPGSFSNLQQQLDLCEALDPEMKAALVNSWQSTEDGDLFDDEPFAF